MPEQAVPEVPVISFRQRLYSEKHKNVHDVRFAFLGIQVDIQNHRVVHSVELEEESLCVLHCG